MNDAKDSWLIVFAAIVVVTGALVIVMMFTVIMTVVMAVAVAMSMVLVIVMAFFLCAVEPKFRRCISNHTLQTANTSQNISKIILDVRIYGQ